MEHALTTLKDLFAAEAAAFARAEVAFADALDRLAGLAGSEALDGLLRAQADLALLQAERLLDFAGGADGVSGPGAAAAGIVAEAEEIWWETADYIVMQAAMIGAATAIKHYELSRLGTLAAWARSLDRPDVAALLDWALEETRVAARQLALWTERPPGAAGLRH